MQFKGFNIHSVSVGDWGARRPHGKDKTVEDIHHAWTADVQWTQGQGSNKTVINLGEYHLYIFAWSNLQKWSLSFYFLRYPLQSFCENYRKLYLKITQIHIHVKFRNFIIAFRILCTISNPLLCQHILQSVGLIHLSPHLSPLEISNTYCAGLYFSKVQKGHHRHKTFRWVILLQISSSLHSVHKIWSTDLSRHFAIIWSDRSPTTLHLNFQIHTVHIYIHLMFRNVTIT